MTLKKLKAEAEKTLVEVQAALEEDGEWNCPSKAGYNGVNSSEALPVVEYFVRMIRATNLSQPIKTGKGTRRA